LLYLLAGKEVDTMTGMKGGVLTEIQRPVGAKPRERARPKLEEYGGLCAVCSRASSCTYRRQFGEPRLFCDELEGGLAIQKRSADEQIVLLAHSQSGPRNDGDDIGRERGLCGHCENREYCTYPKPEGGVWHCDEYK
jgi:hypothetical protein